MAVVEVVLLSTKVVVGRRRTISTVPERTRGTVRRGRATGAQTSGEVSLLHAAFQGGLVEGVATARRKPCVGLSGRIA